MNARAKILVLDNEILMIREYKPADRRSCIDIFKSNEPLYFMPEELKLLENWLDSKDKNTIAYKNNLAEFFYVVEQNSKVIACGGFYVTDRTTANMTWGMVENSFHKKGIGKEFLLFRIEEIKRLYPTHTILLDTSQHTYPFFEKLGFTVVQITREGYGKNLDRYDMIFE